MATIFTDDFESYSVGNLNGQGSWAVTTGPTTAVKVQSDEVKEGTKAGSFETTDVVIVSKSGDMTDDGRIAFYFNKTSQAAKTYFYLYEGSSDRVLMYINDSGYIQYYSGGYVNIQQYNENQWYLVEIEWRSVDHKVRYRVDEDTWTSWVAPFAAWTSGLDKVSMTLRDYSASEHFYFDHFAEDPISDAANTTNFFNFL